MLKLNRESHRRLNPLTNEWVLVSPNRINRPWQGKIEPTVNANPPSYDPKCYLCPGNRRASGITNPSYESTFVFDNDFPVHTDGIDESDYRREKLLAMKSERGMSGVVCFSPRHDATLARMSPGEIRNVINTWIDQIVDISTRRHIRYIQIFENKGEMMGCSNPHPHCQIWATESIPNEIHKEDVMQHEYRVSNRSEGLLSDYLRFEMKLNERIFTRNDAWVALVPFWAAWPFETMLIPMRRISNLTQLNDEERNGLAEILKKTTTRYDNLFKTSFPYTMGFHQAPINPSHDMHWHLHAHFYPPLLRSASIKKHMVGFEMLCEPERDFPPEDAAQALRAVPDIHYLDSGSR